MKQRETNKKRLLDQRKLILISGAVILFSLLPITSVLGSNEKILSIVTPLIIGTYTIMVYDYFIHKIIKVKLIINNNKRLPSFFKDEKSPSVILFCFLMVVLYFFLVFTIPRQIFGYGIYLLAGAFFATYLEKSILDHILDIKIPYKHFIDGFLFSFLIPFALVSIYLVYEYLMSTYWKDILIVNALYPIIFYGFLGISVIIMYRYITKLKHDYDSL